VGSICDYHTVGGFCFVAAAISTAAANDENDSNAFCEFCQPGIITYEKSKLRTMCAPNALAPQPRSLDCWIRG
jgi:hypothetical protein